MAQLHARHPLPRVHAFGRGEPLIRARSMTQAYLILDYVPGQSLDVQCLARDTRECRDHFYSQLIDIIAQMRQLEFPSAGFLMPDSSGGPGPVMGPLSSTHINEMQVQGLRAVTPQSPFKPSTDLVGDSEAMVLHSGYAEVEVGGPKPPSPWMHQAAHTNRRWKDCGVDASRQP